MTSKVEYCNRCFRTDPEEDRILYELAHARDRSLDGMLKRNNLPNLYEKSDKLTQARLRANERKIAEYRKELKRCLEEKASRQIEGLGEESRVQELEKEINRLRWQSREITAEDLKESLERYFETGYLALEDENIRIAPKGAGRLAKLALGRVLKKLVQKEIGPHFRDATGLGTELAVLSRRYVPGDEYYRVDLETTFLNAFERNPPGVTGGGTIPLESEDFQVYERRHDRKMLAGLIIDESGSMIGDKVDAAIDIALALSQLIRKRPEDLLKVYMFTHQVREIPYYDISNVRFSAGAYTDIGHALQTFRRAISGKEGDKQVYLITDSESNTENGQYIEFERARHGVIQEALRYRRSGIALNIIMLDESPHLKKFASLLSKKNLGRVFFTSPSKLGDVHFEDYCCKR